MLNLAGYDLQNSQLYEQLLPETKALIGSIDKTVSELFDQSLNVFERKLNIKSDLDSQWISYVLVVESAPDGTLAHNKKFIEYCLSHGLKNLLTSNVVFRFETRNITHATTEPTETARCSQGFTNHP